MPFTADSELELLFPAALIPQEVKDSLHADLHVSSLAFLYGFAIDLRRRFVHWHPQTTDVGTCRSCLC